MGTSRRTRFHFVLLLSLGGAPAACGGSSSSESGDVEATSGAGVSGSNGVAGRAGSAGGSDAGVSGSNAGAGGSDPAGGRLGSGGASSAGMSGAQASGRGGDAGYGGAVGSGGDVGEAGDFAVGGAETAGTAGTSAAGGGGEGAVMCVGAAVSFPTFEKGCEIPSDCVVVEHTTDCCGGMLVMALRNDQKPAFDQAEAICDSQYPLCGCAAQWADVEDGTQIPFERTDEVQAVCESELCKAVFPMEAFDCLDQHCVAGSYCEITTGGPAGSEPSARCESTTCTNCDCLGIVGCNCSPIDGHLEVTCNYP